MRNNPERARRHAIERIRGLLLRLHSPRLHMALIVALTASVGFLCSYTLMHAGIASLSLRYLIAAVLAYLAFLFLLWGWVRLRRDDLWEGLDMAQLPLDLTQVPLDGVSGGPLLEAGGGEFGGGGASASFDADLHAHAAVASPADAAPDGSLLSDAASGFDLDELVLVIFVILAVLGGLWAAVSVVWAAPVFLAELLLDVALAGGLYRKLRGVEGDHWLKTALRKTALPFVVVAAIFVTSGAIMETNAPEARSIGEVVRYLRSGD